MSEAQAKPRVITLKGRKVVGGKATAEALVSTQTISGWGGINEREGSVIELHHQLNGVSFAGKVLVFPGAKGSSGWSAYWHMCRLNGTAPAAMIFTRMTTKIALGAVVSRVPTVTDLDGDVFELIETGDLVEVDADAGVVTITKR
ncbi:aconitase X swivel domain-containing protein [Oricola sp.]|uniref:aconitase X swivel domain-containing protein n=1 Tax=Oricola sp. TaxID=1979950 RepID=UPI000C8FBE30|nr:hypothetical protein [Ahrensia sp.]|tara:strand:+ start:221943 stop:222377 length:435 start_codon:yes stop_codon:yes gene_type:complete